MPTRPMNLLPTHLKSRQQGSTPKVILWVISALGMGAVIARKMYRSGESDLVFILAMSLAGIIAMIMVAPSLFSGKQRDASDWSSEIRALRTRKTPPVSDVNDKAGTENSNGKDANKA